MTFAVDAHPLDLRVWLDHVRELGELTEVSGAHWNLELGAISELNVKKAVPHALLFDDIPDYAPGFRVLTCSTSSPTRLSSLLRLDLQRSHGGLVDTLRGRPRQWQAAAANFNPVTVEDGPVFLRRGADAPMEGCPNRCRRAQAREAADVLDSLGAGPQTPPDRRNLLAA